MSFFLQLKLLVWKNYTLRKRQWVGICLVIKMWKYSEYNMYHFQGRLIVEIVWPLILFLILFLVRLRGLKKYHHECKFKSLTSYHSFEKNLQLIIPSKGHFEEKVMPSAGFIPFAQSFICTFNNTCHQNTWTQPGTLQEYNQSL